MARDCDHVTEWAEFVGEDVPESASRRERAVRTAEYSEEFS